MARLSLKPWEPEEAVGSLWHAFLDGQAAQPTNHDASVTLEEMTGRLAVVFRGLGGDQGVEIRPALADETPPRRSFTERLSGSQPGPAGASFDGEILRLPALIDWSPQREANEGFYLWLSAACALAPPPQPLPEDPLQADLQRLRRARQLSLATLQTCPGLGALHDSLAAASLALRAPASGLSEQETAVEAVLRRLLDPQAPRGGSLAACYAMLVLDPERRLDDVTAAGRYRPFRPPPLWPERPPPQARQSPGQREATEERSDAGSAEKKGVFRAKRRKSDQAERKDSLILHRFESILSWAEFLNLNRRVDDDDEESAKKAADDHDHLSLTTDSKAPKTRLKLHLDLAPEDVDREGLAGEHLYPEWDYRRGGYWPAHARVLASTAEAGEQPAPTAIDAADRRRIRAVKRQFEALRPKRVILPRQTEGDELDLDAAVRAQVDFRASGEVAERVYRATRTAERDLSVAILFDSSRSTESAVAERSVIEVAREALTALAWGLEACGDDAAIYAFSSLKRDRVYVETCKAFEEAMGPGVEARIAQLRPRFYTRLGAAVRHVSGELQARPRSRRLLLILTDGKPNDLDHYEGRYGVEDSRKAIQEARRAGQSVFAVTIDSKSRDHFGRIFGPGGFAVVVRPDRLTAALPQLYRHLVQA